jgi:hypothetical protein
LGAPGRRSRVGGTGVALWGFRAVTAASLGVFLISFPTPTGGALPFDSNGGRGPPLPLRAILGISLLLLGVAMLSCRVESSGESESAKPQAAAAGVRWVRTVDGWERPDVWHLEAAGRPGLHPLVVAAGQGLLSVLGLVVFQREGR